MNSHGPSLKTGFLPLPDRPSFPNATEAISIESMRQVFDAFDARERALEMRIEALGFEADESLAALEVSSERQNTSRNPVLGIRLLQRLDILQKENDDLSQRLEQVIESDAHIRAAEYEAELHGTLFTILLTSDSHELIAALDEALTRAEANKC